MEECAVVEVWREEMPIAVWCGVEEDFGLLAVGLGKGASGDVEWWLMACAGRA